MLTMWFSTPLQMLMEFTFVWIISYHLFLFFCFNSDFNPRTIFLYKLYHGLSVFLWIWQHRAPVSPWCDLATFKWAVQSRPSSYENVRQTGVPGVRRLHFCLLILPRSQIWQVYNSTAGRAQHKCYTDELDTSCPI